MPSSSIRELKITTLADNLTMTSCLGQWGLSLLLELIDAKGDRKKIVFDTGMSKNALLRNVKALKADINDIECIVLSHGHLDHTAATAELVKLAGGGVKVFAHPYTFLPRFHKSPNEKKRRMGVPRGERIADIEKNGGKVVLSSKPVEIVPGLWTTGEIERITAYENVLPLSKGERVTILTDGNEIEDRILDDQALWTRIDKIGAFVITGCAHSGTINTLAYVRKTGGFKQIHALVGGTHLIGRSDEYLKKTIADLKDYGLKLLSPCHCTGFKAMAALFKAFPEAFVLNFSGRTIEAEKETRPKIV